MNSVVTTDQASSTLRRRHRSRFKKLRRQFARFFNLRLILAIVVSLLLVSIALGSVVITDTMGRVQGSLNTLNRVSSKLGTQSLTGMTYEDFQSIHEDLVDVSNNFQRARQQLALLRPFAGLDSNLAINMQLMETAPDIAQAAVHILSGLEPVLFFLTGGVDKENQASRISSSQRIIELLELGQSQFMYAESLLAGAQEDIEALELSTTSPDAIRQISTLVDYHESLQQANNILLKLPALLTSALGFNHDQTILILSQNNDELRPSGGFISTYGWMLVEDGQIQNYEYYPSTATNPNPPSDKLADMVDIPSWWIQYQNPIYAAWDGSWYADFPSTAEMSKWYYDNGNNLHAPVDTVLAIDLTGFEYILSALGAVEVDEHDVTVTENNFREVVYDVRAHVEGITPHKVLVADVFESIFDEWQQIGHDSEKSSHLLEGVVQALQEKHVILYSSDPGLQDVLRILGWDGSRGKNDEGDYLMVVDANLGNKSNRSIQRQQTIDIELHKDGSAYHKLTVDYDYSASVAENDPAVNSEFHGPLDYRNILQIYLPGTTRVVSSTNLPSGYVTTDEPGFSEVIAQIGTEYDSDSRVQFEYVSDDVVTDSGSYKRYRLAVDKQPGTNADSVVIHLALPESTSVIDINPEPVAMYDLENTVLEFAFSLDTNHEVEVIFSDD